MYMYSENCETHKSMVIYISDLIIASMIGLCESIYRRDLIMGSMNYNKEFGILLLSSGESIISLWVLNLVKLENPSLIQKALFKL
ncbi:hypothetical protein BpHYR1_035390 [Brachionus plicatilis]|uniref:Uncharacterized protein n=1 Tax=Brachionus plicatilis TaxID=10195 RepID=A0A3M7SD48_BRAPC|nr:hypothetical protein BpHYR1_035390 [Brachionus plicatilis]